MTQPPTKKIKFDWPNLLAGIFSQDTKAALAAHGPLTVENVNEIFEVIRARPNLLHVGLSMMQISNVFPSNDAQFDDFLLQIPNISEDIGKCMFRNDAKNNTMLMRALERYQNDTDSVFAIFDAFDACQNTAVSVCTMEMIALFFRLTLKYPYFMYETGHCLLLHNYTIDMATAWYTEMFVLVNVHNSLELFRQWMRIGFELTCNDLPSQTNFLELLSSRIGCANTRIMSIFVWLVNVHNEHIRKNDKITELVQQALFFCYEDEQKHMYLPLYVAFDEEQPGYMNENEEIDEIISNLNARSADAAKSFGSTEVITCLVQLGLQNMKYPSLLGRALTFGTLIDANTQGNLLQHILDISKFPLELKIGLCSVQWCAELDLARLHLMVVDWLVHEKYSYDVNRTLL